MKRDIGRWCDWLPHVSVACIADDTHDLKPGLVGSFLERLSQWIFTIEICFRERFIDDCKAGGRDPPLPIREVKYSVWDVQLSGGVMFDQEPKTEHKPLDVVF